MTIGKELHLTFFHKNNEHKLIIYITTGEIIVKDKNGKTIKKWRLKRLDKETLDAFIHLLYLAGFL